MRGVYQTRFNPGNCWEACIATLIGCPLEDVPEWPSDPEQGPDYIASLREWLSERFGLTLLWLQRKALEASWGGAWALRITVVETSETTCHAVICRGSEIVWDPHPDPPHDLDGAVLDHYYLVPLDVSQCITPEMRTGHILKRWGGTLRRLAQS